MVFKHFMEALLLPWRMSSGAVPGEGEGCVPTWVVALDVNQSAGVFGIPANSCRACLRSLKLILCVFLEPVID